MTSVDGSPPTEHGKNRSMFTSFFVTLVILAIAAFFGGLLVAVNVAPWGYAILIVGVVAGLVGLIGLLRYRALGRGTR